MLILLHDATALLLAHTSRLTLFSCRASMLTGKILQVIAIILIIMGVPKMTLFNSPKQAACMTTVFKMRI